jgi:hypothetical protein
MKLLEGVHSCMLPYYLFYADKSTKLMNLEDYQNFLCDFQIFPNILNRSQITYIFQKLSPIQ